MEKGIAAIVEKIRALEEELEKTIEKSGERLEYTIEKRKISFEREILKQHRKLRKGLLQFLRESGFISLLISPIVYAMIIPLSLADLFATIYQFVCFPVYRIAQVKRSQYVVIDRHKLSYLNLIEKINCVYCGYANGVIAYIREIASLSEQHFCPIKHALKVKKTHDRYLRFLEYGDGESLRKQQKSSEKN